MFTLRLFRPQFLCSLHSHFSISAIGQHKQLQIINHRVDVVGDVNLAFLQLHLSTFFKPETLCSYTRSSPPLPSSSNYDQNSILHLMCTCNPRDSWMAREHKTYRTNINRLFPSNSILTSWLRLAISLPRSTSGVQNISIDQRRNLTLTFQNLKSKTCTLCQSHDHARRYGNLPSSVCHPI